MPKFEPTFSSLRKFKCPEWLLDAKFGIWSHWGPQSVPMAGDWYARNMYIEGHEQYNFHVRNYGHPSKFGYKDICKLWRAENFNPGELMALYKKAGARYFMAQSTHHDNYFNYDSDINPMNSVKVGPGKDICALWQAAAKEQGMYFGLTEHLGASYSWWRTNKYCDSYGPYKGVPYDGNDPENKEYYYDNYEHKGDINSIKPWYTTNKKFHEYWLKCVTEMIDKFTPDVLYSDGGLPFGEHNGRVGPYSSTEDALYDVGLKAVSHLYNKSYEKHGDERCVYLQKDTRPEVYTIGVLDIEKSQLPEISEHPWHTDTCIGHWFYDSKHKWKTPDQIIEMLIDIISKNGMMLLNVLQRPDGTIDDEARWILEELADWFDICGEAVHGTRPFRIFGEGDTRVLIDGFREDKTAFNSSDWRFTKKDSTLYAFMMRPAENGVAVIKSLTPSEAVKDVTLLGFGRLEYTQSFGTLCVKLPQKMPTEYTNCLKIEL